MLPKCEEAEIRGMLENKEQLVDQGVVNNKPRLFAIYGRRTMLSKIWCQEIGRRWCQRRQESLHARLLTQPKCRTYVTLWYLVYRWIIFLLWAIVTVCSIYEIGSYEPLEMYEKWPIYLTNWDIALGLTQALIGSVLVSKRWQLQQIPGFDPHYLKFEVMERFYWFLYIVTTNMAIGVTFCYWIMVYDPKIHLLDPLNIMIHVCNSLLMLIDLFVTSVPFRLRYFWWCLSIVLFYLIFSIIYYAAGGLDKQGYHYIYKVLDWEKPGRAMLACVGGLTFVMVLHCVVCLMTDARDYLYNKFSENSDRKPVIDDRALSEKLTEMV